MDLRENKQTMKKLKEKHLKPISKEEATEKSQKNEAKIYLEYGTLDKKSVKEILDKAVEFGVVDYTKKSEKKKLRKSKKSEKKEKDEKKGDKKTLGDSKTLGSSSEKRRKEKSDGKEKTGEKKIKRQRTVRRKSPFASDRENAIQLFFSPKNEKISSKKILLELVSKNSDQCDGVIYGLLCICFEEEKLVEEAAKYKKLALPMYGKKQREKRKKEENEQQDKERKQERTKKKETKRKGKRKHEK